MTDEELRIKVAELVGWTDIGLGNHWDGEHTVETLVGYPPDETPGDYWTPVPDYPNDLNAMHDVVSQLTEVEYNKFCDVLWNACGGAAGKTGAINATAHQRALAFVKVTGNKI